MDDKATSKLLFHAITKGQFKAVKILVSGGADVNLQDSKGQTVLKKACEKLGTGAVEETSPEYKIVSYLLENNADPTIKDQHGICVLDMPQIESFLVLHKTSRTDTKEERIYNRDLSEGVIPSKHLTGLSNIKPFPGYLHGSSSSNTDTNNTHAQKFRDRSSTEGILQETSVQQRISHRRRSNTDGRIITITKNVKTKAGLYEKTANMTTEKQSPNSEHGKDGVPPSKVTSTEVALNDIEVSFDDI